MIAFLVGIALAAAPMPAPATQTTASVKQSEVDRAADLIGAGKPAEAVAILDALIASQEARRKNETRQLYCARSPAEALFYSGIAGKERKAAVVLPQDDCYSIFLKGFALIDLNRRDEAKAYLERAIAMAPSNAHFLGELAEWYKNKRDFDTSWTLFQRAVDASSLSPVSRRIFDKTRGMRGLGYILIERGKLDEAERIYRDCLKMDPNDQRAKAQLDYIAAQRKKS